MNTGIFHAVLPKEVDKATGQGVLAFLKIKERAQ